MSTAGPDLRSEQKRRRPPWLLEALRSQHAVSAVSGAGAGAIAAVIVCPLDVVKTRLQIFAAGELSYKSISGGIAAIARAEGLAGLYCGLTPSLIALLPNWAVYFSVYEGMKSVFAKSGAAQRASRKPATPEAARAMERAEQRRTHLVNMAAAACAGAATVFTTNPLWVAKTRLQVQSMVSLTSRTATPAWNARLYSGTRNCVARIAKEEGIGGLYSGLGPSLLGVGHVMIQFPVYEAGKTWLLSTAGENGEERELSTAELIGVSSVAKLAASLVSYPHEVLRSRMHVLGTGPFKGMGTIARAVWAEGGVKGFYRGFVTSLIRTVPAGAVTITSFELISRHLNAVTATLAAQFEEEEAEEQQQRQKQQGGERPGGKQKQ